MIIDLADLFIFARFFVNKSLWLDRYLLWLLIFDGKALERWLPDQILLVKKHFNQNLEWFIIKKVALLFLLDKDHHRWSCQLDPEKATSDLILVLRFGKNKI